MSNFRLIKRDMNYLFPPSMYDWLPEHHLARFVVEIVEQLDLGGMECAYGTSGSASHCYCPFWYVQQARVVGEFNGKSDRLLVPTELLQVNGSSIRAF